MSNKTLNLRFMQLTWLDSNSWLIEIARKRILIDPWLVGSLVFGNLDWLFKGIKSITYTIDQPIDLIILSQGLEDHTHIPTLTELDHNIPVVASPNAAKIVKELGYKQVTELAHGQSYTLDNSITIKAVPGSPLGPQLTENGYIITDLIEQQKIYYEPHGYHSSTLTEEGKINVVITPIVGLSILHLVPILKGEKTTLELCQTLKPQVILPTAGSGKVDYEGFLSSVIREEGTIAGFRQMLAKYNLVTSVLTPQPGQTVQVTLASV
ncbi:beta-lactamase [Aphanothece sacrum FPU3]|nr:beta-lactamase [Aphanothece sacrum FPU3]